MPISRWLAMPLLCFALTAQSREIPAPLPGVQDHPAVSRYKGAVLYNAASERFAALRIPLAPGKLKNSGVAFDTAIAVEGKISAYFYVLPPAVQPLEVFRNYQAALTQAGLKALYSCELTACEEAFIPEYYRHDLLNARKWTEGRIAPATSAPRELRYWSGKATRNGADLYVIVWVAEPDSVWEATTVNIVVMEPAAMQAGQVTVALDQLQRGLQAEGKVALYGLYFDTGKAEVKPESKPQLEEMAKLLKADPALRVFIVGHTDNQGTLDANVALSQRRAEAVAAALAAQHGIDAKRLIARGVANYSPVSNNAGEPGRAKNRRVELVAQ